MQGQPPYPPATMKRTNHGLLASGLAALALAGAACAQEARPQILSDNGPAHHHALHSQNPILARYKGLYPRRVHLTVDDTGEQYTILNEGPRFEVAAGHYGTPNLILEMPNEEIQAVYEMVRAGAMPEGVPRVEMAIKVKEFTQLSFDLPQDKDPNPSGPGPRLSKEAELLVHFYETRLKGIEYMAKAGEAQGAGKKLPMIYFGLLGKLAVSKGNKLGEKIARRLFSELGRDLDQGQLAISPGGPWSTFVDVNCFYNMVRGTQDFGTVLGMLEQRIKGLLNYHKTLPPSDNLATRQEILEDRLALVEKLKELLDT